ncbi:MAG: hypothetical protein EPN92_09020 [Chitinophagaceae bacterium]|nr:MAG: hypothetical protein EPN92_09020 [Chitinophagaceae bacterium]
MNFLKTIFLQSIFLFAAQALHAQQIVYSEPDRDDSRRMIFEVIGKMGNNFLIYKNIRSDNFICVYDNNMKLIQKTKHEYLPDERLINVDFFPYTDHIYMIYQYQKRNIVHCAAVKLDPMGKKITDPVELDTSQIGFSANNKIYTVLSTEDKKKIIIFKINSRDKQKFLISTKLYTDNLELLKSSRLIMPMDERNDYLGEFTADNDGNLVFSKYYRNSNENITKAYLVIKKAMEDSFFYYKINLDKIYLDDVRIRVDNGNNKYYLNAFYYKQKRGNIDGLYFLVWDKASSSPSLENTHTFNEDLRSEAKGESNIKMAFNDYFIRNVIPKKDGGFILSAEAYYTTSRFNAWNRWDYMYRSPWLMNSLDYYYYSSYYNNYFWRNGGTGGQSVRYHADNVIIISLDKEGKLEWNNVIRKDQFDDDSDDLLSYQLMNTGGQLHFLFNLLERRNLLLNDFAMTPDGQISRNPTLKNLDKGYEFMPKFGKQVSAKILIVPCYYRNYICFGKIDFN